MGEVINLNRARKSRAKAEAKVEAAHNRAAHGRPKVEQDLAHAQADKRNRDLDGAKIERDEPES